MPTFTPPMRPFQLPAPTFQLAVSSSRAAMPPLLLAKPLFESGIAGINNRKSRRQ